jgi:transmembrane sensor
MLGLGSQTLRETIPTIHPVPKLETLFYRHRWVWLWSSVVTVLIGAAIFLTQQAPTIHTDVTPRVYTTSAHQRANVDLADGSRVMLAPQTTLRVPRLDAQSRTVILDSGEAYFEVMHGSAQPFIVGSGDVTAQVLGTAFLIRHTAGDPYVHIAVTDGKVRVTIPTHRIGITLTRGQMGDVTDSTSQVSTTDDLAPGIQWGPGHIMFRDTPLATVLEVTARWYGFHFRYADQTFGQQSVTLMISTRSSAEALATIEQMLAVNLSVVGDTITLVPKPPQSLYSAPRLQTYDVWTPKSEVGR